MEGYDPAAQSVSCGVLFQGRWLQLDMKYNKQGNQATLAWPVATTLASFFDRLSWFEDILALVSFFVALVGALIIFATLRLVMNEKSGICIIRCLGASRLMVTRWCLLSPCFCPRGLLGAFLAYWGIGHRGPFDSRKDGRRDGSFVLGHASQENERQSFGIWSKRRGMKPCGPWSNPFSSFGFSAWNFSNRIRKWLDSRSSGISFKPVRQLEP